MRNIVIGMTALVASISVALAGDISGTVTDEAGRPLQKVLVCLRSDAQSKSCDKTRQTNKRGTYSFKKLQGSYTVSISSGTSLAARKLNPYPTYAWLPVAKTVSIGRSTSVSVDFLGGFNFSNYQDGLVLSSVDFPGLIDGSCLKVYFVDAGDVENLLFIGTVAETTNFSLEVNVPLTTSTIYYDVFCSTPASGSISLDQA